MEGLFDEKGGASLTQKLSLTICQKQNLTIDTLSRFPGTCSCTDRQSTPTRGARTLVPRLAVCLRTALVRVARTHIHTALLLCCVRTIRMPHERTICRPRSMVVRALSGRHHAGRGTPLRCITSISICTCIHFIHLIHLPHILLHAARVARALRHVEEQVEQREVDPRVQVPAVLRAIRRPLAQAWGGRA